ncbi:hypothetical protein L9F63_001299 [Diploptera punctata]|uniref:Uncharacterized protein n=1 Tax=Diploptera punctata TaxID=6984 RepID=A0AAD8EJ58_DIPPU|nr:hypothetical protein L9F63_001299 [Diploptera punctata]
MIYENEQIHIINKFLNLLNEAVIWPLMISSRGDSLKVRKQDSDSRVTPITKDDAYVIFTPTDISSTSGMNELNNQIDLISASPFWNPLVNFLFVVTDRITESPENITENILNGLWTQNKVLNSLISIPFYRNSSSENDTKTVNIAEVETYTWISRQSKKNCMEFSGILKVDKCSKETRFCNITRLKMIASKIPSNFEGCPLKFISPLRNREILEKENGEIEVIYSEPEMHFIQLAFNKLNFTIKYLPPLTLFPDYVENVVAATLTLVTGDSDIALGYMAIGDEMSKYADYSMCYYFFYYRWYVPCGRMFSRATTLARVFSLSVWLSFAISLILVALVLRFRAHLYSLQKLTEPCIYRSIVSCFISLWAVVLGVSVVEMPSNTGIRMFFLLFVWYSFTINTIFQTFFTSCIVSPGKEPRIRNFEELLESSIELGYEHHVQHSLQSSPDPKIKKIIERHIVCSDRHYCFGRVDITSDFAYLQNQISAQWYTTQYKSSRICELEDGGFMFMYATHFVKNSIYVKVFNKVFYKLFESGIITKIINDYFMEVILGRKVNVWYLKIRNETLVDTFEKESQEYFVNFSLNHMQSPFYLLLLGYALSFVTFLFEKYYIKFYKRK